MSREIILASPESVPYWGGEWIYIGRSYTLLKSCEKRLGKKSIPLKKYIDKNKPEDLTRILNWIDRQSAVNGDSLYWWMTRLAGKNNLESRFFEDIIQLSAFKSWALENQSIGALLVVCDDYHLALSIQENIASDFKVELQNAFFWRCKTLLAVFQRIVLGWSSALLRCLMRIYAAKVTQQKNKDRPSGEVYLIHQCLDEKSFLDSSKITDRYFGVLPLWIESKGERVYRLPWLFNARRGVINKYKKIREHLCFLPEEWVNLRDLFGVFSDAMRSVSSIRLDVLYADLKISHLLARERWGEISHGASNIEFWMVKYALPKWGRDLSFLSYICFFEMVPAEMVCAYTWRMLPNKSGQFFGYYHSLISRDYMSYHFSRNQIESLVFPDKIIVNGCLAKDLLISQGIPASKISSGPALRQSFETTQFSADSPKSLVLLLSLSLDHSAALLCSLAEVSSWINDELGIPVLVKPHPMLPIECILKALKWKSLPSSWGIHHGEMDAVLTQAWCCVTIASASIYDVLLFGCIAIPLAFPLGLSWNYADVIEGQFEVLEAINADEMQLRLEEIFVTKREWYSLEFKKISEYMHKSLSQPDDKNLGVFLTPNR